ncbi:helix-turn-helix domain-containing protein [Methylobacterium sp. J-030]|uniref:helix-turn-helix domain-containing protein n=1 Tax=Methylobacterium sp. J-030 TaxID=2836627 RepID=UPI001FB949CD|nr:helix-turn-helix domain-containing protein [Methylobacterium sp. J-030]MCJ2067358.1 helix-turn-helix domain-containing protein [Methylobacterium sp. J-030]
MLETATSAAALSIAADPFLAMLSEADRKIFQQPTTDLVTAGRLLGVGKNTSYKARRSGDIPTISVCGQHRVSTAWLWQTLSRGFSLAA